MKKLFAIFTILALTLAASFTFASDFHVVSFTHSEVVVGVASGVAIAANDEREYLLLVNDSDASIYLGIGVAAEMNKGIRINAGGGSYEISPRNGNFTTVDINAIAIAATKNLMVTEGE